MINTLDCISEHTDFKFTQLQVNLEESTFCMMNLKYQRLWDGPYVLKLRATRSIFSVDEFIFARITFLQILHSQKIAEYFFRPIEKLLSDDLFSKTITFLNALFRESLGIALFLVPPSTILGR